MGAGRTTGRSVLIVDSYPDSAAGLAAVLGLYGYAVRVAADPATALAAAGEARPGVVVLDPWRVTADPPALAARLAVAAGARPLLVALTGYVRPADRGRVPGFDHTLLKPCDPGVLARLIAAGHAGAGPARGGSVGP